MCRGREVEALGREAELRAHSEGGSEVVLGRFTGGLPLDLFSVPSLGKGKLNRER